MNFIRKRTAIKAFFWKGDSAQTCIGLLRKRTAIKAFFWKGDSALSWRFDLFPRSMDQRLNDFRKCAGIRR